MVIRVKSILVQLGSPGLKKGHDLDDHGDGDGDNVDDINKSNDRTTMVHIIQHLRMPGVCLQTHCFIVPAKYLPPFACSKSRP